MDGNRRWAKQRGLMPWLGHQAGTDVIKPIIEFCLENKIEFLSLYNLSIENLKRSPEEIDFLLNIMINESQKVLPDLCKYEVKVRFIGDPSLFPEKVKPVINKIETETNRFNKLHLNLLFCYGGRQEIMAGIKKIAQDIQQGIINPDQITESLFDNYLWTAAIPDPELIIRTGAQQRLSNFLLIKSAYSELYFTDTLWPDFKKDELIKALEDFKNRQRRYGA